MNDDLSLNRMVEFAMGLSMASLFAKAMNNAMESGKGNAATQPLNGVAKYIHAILDGVQSGPFSLQEVVDLIRAGRITPQTYIWKAGMTEWLPAGEVTDIAPNLNVSPPEFKPL